MKQELGVIRFDHVLESGFYLREENDGTRLIVRARAVFEPRWVGTLVNSFLGPGHWIMQRRQLLNLKARAEDAHRITGD